jgi:UDP-glucose 4-epimerase
MRLLVTGATGYIGSHFVKTAAEAGHSILAADYNLNQNDISEYTKRFFNWDIRVESKHIHNIDKVVHIAAKTKVPESVKNPYDYYLTNVIGTANVAKSLIDPVDHFIYCSTGSAFEPESNPYAGSKYAGELVAKQYCDRTSVVRFYNVSGNDGMSKFDDEYSHLIRKAAAVVNGKFDKLYIHGTDYDTRDGTCIRNYTHIKDIVDSLLRIVENDPTNEIDCLGSPKGYTVKEVIDTMRSVSNTQFEVVETSRRDGDVDISTVPYESKYFKEEKTLEDMCLDALKYEV